MAKATSLAGQTSSLLNYSVVTVYSLLWCLPLTAESLTSYKPLSCLIICDKLYCPVTVELLLMCMLLKGSWIAAPLADSIILRFKCRPPVRMLATIRLAWQISLTNRPLDTSTHQGQVTPCWIISGAREMWLIDHPTWFSISLHASKQLGQQWATERDCSVCWFSLLSLVSWSITANDCSVGVAYIPGCRRSVIELKELRNRNQLTLSPCPVPDLVDI